MEKFAHIATKITLIAKNLAKFLQITMNGKDFQEQKITPENQAALWQKKYSLTRERMLIGIKRKNLTFKNFSRR